MKELEPFNILINHQTEVVRLYPANWPLMEKLKAIYGIVNGEILHLEKEKNG